MKLSILICSLPNRLNNFNVIQDLCNQARNKDVEVIYLGDNRSMTVGEKRNHLVDLANGNYITFVDDDDRVEPDYVDSILDAIKSGADCITYRASVRINNRRAKICYYSNTYSNEDVDGNYLREPNHLMVWNKSIVCKFPEINNGEDYYFGTEMKKKQYTEYAIEKVLYHYDFNSNTTETQKDVL